MVESRSLSLIDSAREMVVALRSLEVFRPPGRDEVGVSTSQESGCTALPGLATRPSPNPLRFASEV